MKKALLATAISLATGTGTALADGILEEVVVTAQKREQAITDVALTVTALNGDVARAMGIEDTRDVAMLATNVDIKGAGMADANPAITIRGIGMNNFNANNNPSVGIYLDEVFLASPAMINLSMMDVGRLEVLKGPQGTLYGRNATGGAVNIISAKPSREMDGFASLNVGNYETTKFEGAVGGPLTDTLSGRISGLYDYQGESFHEYHREGKSDKDFGDSTTYAVRLQLAGNHDRLNWNLSGSYLDQDIANSPFTALGGYWNSPDEVFVTPCRGKFENCVNTLGLDVSDRDGDPFTHDFQESRVDEMRIESEVTSLNLNLDYEWDTVTLTSITGWVQQDRDFGENIWSSPLEAFAVLHDEEMEQFSQEFRLDGGGERVRWLAGVFYWNDTFKSDNIANSADILGLLAGVNPVLWDNDQETTAYAAYGSVDWDITDKLMLTVGLRYSDEETEFEGGTNGTIVDSAAFDDFVGADLGIPEGETIPFTYTDDKISEDNTSYRLALEYRPTDDWLTYGSVTTGFKSGGFFGDFTFDNFELEPFDSETVTAYEIGSKSTLGQTTQLNAAIFYYEYEDIQTFVPSTIGFKLDNLEEADIFGAEIEVLSSPIEGLDIRFGASYLDTEVKSDFPEYDGNELPNSPETQVTGTIRYEFPVSSGMSIALQADGKYTDEMFRESTNNPWLVTDSYTVLHLRASLLATDGTWEVALWGRNITDEEYEQERFASDIVGQVVGLQGNPNTYGLTLNYNL
jgi:iron complex outermembrane receptor protein